MKKILKVFAIYATMGAGLYFGLTVMQIIFSLLERR